MSLLFPAGVLALTFVRQSMAGSCSEPDESGLLQSRAILGARVDLSADNYTFTDPNPDYLQWDTKFELPSARFGGVTYLGGWLNVALFYDELIEAYETPPRACLRVWGVAASQQPSRNGPLLVHNGGPGSTIDGAPMGVSSWRSPFSDATESFDILGIAQRGKNWTVFAQMLGLSGTNGTGYLDNASDCPFKQSDGSPVREFPISSACDEISTKIGELCGNVTDTGCKAFDDWLSGVMPEYKEVMNWTEVTQHSSHPLKYYNEASVRWRYRLYQLNNNLCFKARRFQLTAPNGRVYNTFNYAGTAHLAHDIDLLRQAVGAEKISIQGHSYGTMVAAVFATIFPENTHRLIMDGVVTPDPDVLDWANDEARGMYAVWNGFAEACDNSLRQGKPPEEACPLAPGSSTKLYKMLEKGGEVGIKAKRYVTQMVLSTDSTSNSASTAALMMHCLARVNGANDTACDDLIFGLSSMSLGGEPPYDCCDQASALGLDIPGRLNEEDAIAQWKRLRALYPTGMDYGMAFLFYIATWPAIARPVPPLQSLEVKPLILGNLWDAKTAYANAQKMSTAFPRGSLMTWQGYGHCIQSPDNASSVWDNLQAKKGNGSFVHYTDEEGKMVCMKRAWDYLDSGKLPSRGYVCKAAEEIPLGKKSSETAVELLKTLLDLLNQTNLTGPGQDALPPALLDQLRRRHIYSI